MMLKKLYTLVLLVLLFCSVNACSNDRSLNGKQGVEQLSGLWINDSGLYYLSMPKNEPISFVLPNTAATLSKNTVATLTEKGLQLKDGTASFLIPINDMPPRFGGHKCLEADNTRLCLANR